MIGGSAGNLAACRCPPIAITLRLPVVSSGWLSLRLTSSFVRGLVVCFHCDRRRHLRHRRRHIGRRHHCYHHKLTPRVHAE